MDQLITSFNAKTAAVQGSGWGWLCVAPETKTLVFRATKDQDLISETGLVPLLNIDVWEHAYYLDYKNMRPDFLKEIWKVVNWQKVEQRYADAMK